MIRSFKRKETCPACGQRGVGREEETLWACGKCFANGPILAGVVVDFGLRGDPRSNYERHRPRISVAGQLLDVIPELRGVAADEELSERLNDSYFRWNHELTATTFDIGDPDVQAAEAVGVRNLVADPELRADDVRFYMLTACSTGGWHWRRAEQPEDAPTAPEAAHQWLERYQSRGDSGDRSQTIGQVASAIEDDARLEEHSPGGATSGHAFQAAGWLLTRDSFITPQPQLAGLHPEDRLQRSFRFGIALRDAQVAYDAAAD